MAHASLTLKRHDIASIVKLARYLLECTSSMEFSIPITIHVQFVGQERKTIEMNTINPLLFLANLIPLTVNRFESPATLGRLRLSQARINPHEKSLTNRFCRLVGGVVLCLLSLLDSRGAIAQNTNVLDVNVTGIDKDIDFVNRYDFQGETNARKGVLKTGGFLTSYTVTKYVTEERSKTENYQVVFYINGKRVVETRQRVINYTVRVPVKEEIPLRLPIVWGKWYSLGNKASSVWLVSSASSSGIVIGCGLRYDQQINGFMTYLFTSRPPTGTYEVSPLFAP